MDKNDGRGGIKSAVFIEKTEEDCRAVWGANGMRRDAAGARAGGRDGKPAGQIMSALIAKKRPKLPRLAQRAQGKKKSVFSCFFNKTVDKVPKTVDKVLKLWINIHAMRRAAGAQVCALGLLLPF